MQFKTLASAVALALVGLTSVHAAEEKSVAVTAIVEHPALDAVRDGIQDALKEAKRMKDAKELSEDDVKRIEKGLDDDMKVFQVKIDDIFKAKEKEVMTV